MCWPVITCELFPPTISPAHTVAVVELNPGLCEVELTEAFCSHLHSPPDSNPYPVPCSATANCSQLSPIYSLLSARTNQNQNLWFF